MAIKVFVAGVTGYIGGDAFYEIATAHPECEFACLVRNSDKGAQVASQYSKVRLVYGDLDSVEILEKEAQEADIVLNCASADHEAATKALIKGLTAGDSHAGPKFLIHTSGTGILMYKDIQSNINKEPKTLGEAADEIYDDWDGVAQVTSLPDTAPHRKVDKLIIESDGPKLNTAIVCPPTIYGVGRGPGNVRGHQLYELARCTLEKGHGLQIGAGKTFWTNIHVKDLSKVYLRLFDAASKGGGEAAWGAEGYYFTENGEHVWGDVSKAVALEAKKQGLISDDQVVPISAEEGDQLTKSGSNLWGANSRGRAIRARKLFGWTPIEKGMYEEIPNAVSSEARRLGLTSGHGTKAAGLE